MRHLSKLQMVVLEDGEVTGDASAWQVAAYRVFLSVFVFAMGGNRSRT